MPVYRSVEREAIPVEDANFWVRKWSVQGLIVFIAGLT
jgi:hypothetical protein